MTSVIARHWGTVAYQPIYQAMQQFTETRDAHTIDELWLLEHFPVYTLGMAGKSEHLLNTGNIPVIPVDRGGQVTYHGPGQLIVYLLMDLKRRNWGIKQLVTALEQAIIDFLAAQQITATRRDKAPGVYVATGKIAALGLRVRKGCCYHGLSLNINMNLTPFFGINPCGYQNLAITQLYDLGIKQPFYEITAEFLTYLLNTLAYTWVKQA